MRILKFQITLDAEEITHEKLVKHLIEDNEPEREIDFLRGWSAAERFLISKVLTFNLGAGI